MKSTLTRRRTSQPVLFWCLLLSGRGAAAFTVRRVRAGSSSAVLPSSVSTRPSISVRGARTTTETKQAAHSNSIRRQEGSCLGPLHCDERVFQRSRHSTRQGLRRNPTRWHGPIRHSFQTDGASRSARHSSSRVVDHLGECSDGAWYVIVCTALNGWMYGTDQQTNNKLNVVSNKTQIEGWYGFYKYSVEEELYQYELQTEGKVSGCGGFGTLLPFVFGVIVGFPLTLLHIPAGETILQAASVWILAGQVNLYRRVNELCDESKEEMGLVDGPVLWEWWALLPPPLDVVVGLRQVHFLSEYWRIKRGEPYEKDVIAEDLFPFISAKQRFTLKEFFRTPSMWFWFTTDWKDFDFEILQETESDKKSG